MNKEKLLGRIKQFIRYFFVGGFASVVDYGVSNLAYLLLGRTLLERKELPLQIISAGAGIVVGLIVNYFMSLKFVFNAEKNIKDFLQICLISAISLLITSGLTTLNVNFLHLPFAFFKIIAMGIAFIWNYLARSFWVYNDNDINEQTTQEIVK